jgi:PAS domain S-box-containing protein
LIIKGSNAEALELFGYSEEEFVGMNAMHLVAVRERSKIEAIRAAEIWGEAGSFTYIRKDGSAFRAHIRWHQGDYRRTVCDYTIVTHIESDLRSGDGRAYECHAPPFCSRSSYQ